MWRDRLNDRLRAQREQGRFRAAHASARAAIDCSTNDYLALRSHPTLVEASRRAAAVLGVGAGASRLAGGTLPIHQDLERRFATLKGAERAVLTPTGFHANLAVLTALPDAGDLILCDKRSHASIIDAARLATATHAVAFRTFPHNDARRAHELAERHLAQSPEATIWIATDSVFSMDGDLADLRALASVRDSLDGRACLITDEAHATGVLGPGGAGLDAQLGHPADITVSTASKALGAMGGIVAGPTQVAEAIDNFARAHIYTTALAPPIAAAIDAALDILRDEPQRRERLAAITRRIRAACIEQGWDVKPHDTDPTPIIPLVVGDAERAVEFAMKLHEQGINAPAIRPPTVAPGSSRVRLSLHAGLTDADADTLIKALAR